MSSATSLRNKDSTYKNKSPTPCKKYLSPTSWNIYNFVEKGSGDFIQKGNNQSFIECLLCEIYDRWNSHSGWSRDSFDSDTFTEYSSTSEFVCKNQIYKEEWEREYAGQLRRAFLETKSVNDLRLMVKDLQHSISVMSTRVVRQLKHRDRRMLKMNHHCDVITAILQAASLKRKIDAHMRFSIEPFSSDQSAFSQWRDAMKGVTRLPAGIPNEFRKTVWLNLADNFISSLQVDWDKVLKFAFNEKSNPDDHKLDIQIVKDLHRTGCGNFNGLESDEDRAVLKRVLLAYARWNKTVGYCQGFNIIAALLLIVMDRREDHALKVMIYLVDYVLPNGYFVNNLRSLSVDMAVFRDLLHFKFSKLSHHLDFLQHFTGDKSTGPNYEPPLTNVFTMQWFLTLFATCLPRYIVLRIWDCILLEGSEMLIRTALIIWSKLSSHIFSVATADEFYTVMGYLCQDLMEGKLCNADDIIRSMYELGSFPLPHLKELREKYTYNITPFSVNVGEGKRGPTRAWPLISDEDDLDDDDVEAITCFSGMLSQGFGGSRQRCENDLSVESYLSDISNIGPGAYGTVADNTGGPVCSERMTTDIGALKKQYMKLKHRQAQAHIIISAASKNASRPVMAPKMASPIAINHLFINKDIIKSRNRQNAPSARVASEYPRSSDVLTPFNECVSEKRGSLTTEAIQRVPEEGECRERANSMASQMSEYSATSIASDETKGEGSVCGDFYSDNSDSAIMKECNPPLDNLMIMDTLQEANHNRESTDSVETNKREDEDAPVLQEKMLNLHKCDSNIIEGYPPETEDGSSHNVISNEDSNLINAVRAESRSPDPVAIETSQESSRDPQISNCSNGGETESNKDSDDSGATIESVAVIEQTNINESVCGSSIPHGAQLNSHSATVMEQSSPSAKDKPDDVRRIEDTAIFLYQAHKRRQTRTQSQSSKHPSSLRPTSPPKLPSSYNPFPLRHVNSQRAANGLRLGLYTPEILQAYMGVSATKSRLPKPKKFNSIS